MLTHKDNSDKNHNLCNDLLLIIIVVLIFFNVIFVPSALSQRTATVIGFFTENQITQFTEGQRVKFFGYVNYHGSPEGAVAVQKAYYKIINKDTGIVIYDGYTDDKGTFSFSWTAKSESGTKKVNLQAIFLGSGQYPYDESETYTLEIFKLQRPYDVSLYLDVTKGSRSDSIKVKPTMTYDGGTSFPYGFNVGGNTDFIKIYVNGQVKAVVRPNQWSNDIIVGHDTHTVYAESPQIEPNEVDIFRRATSNALNINLQPLPFDFAISSNPGSRTITAGQTASSTVNLSLTSGSPQPVSLSCSGIPSSQESCKLNGSTQSITVTPSNSITLTIETDTGTSPGTYTATITGSGGGKTHLTSFSVNVQASGTGGSVTSTATGGITGTGTSSVQDPTIFIILGIVAAIGGGIAVAVMKRKKPTPPIMPKDDTQIW